MTTPSNAPTVASGVIPMADRTIFTIVQAHENPHVSFLCSLFGESGLPKPRFGLLTYSASASPNDDMSIT